MQPLFETVVDLQTGAGVLQRRRFGVIEMLGGRLKQIRLRPWPKSSSIVEARCWGRWLHDRRPGDNCRLYYNQPWGSPNFLALRYLVSSRHCTLASVLGALAVLDEIARLKHADAIVCEASNVRISDRMLVRWGWEPHTRNRRHRHFIKRFYGEYAAIDRAQFLAVAEN